ncbi:MAG: chitobiase/beta-hexosaminidase C-terminal domain-containing protein, partial [Chitinispirillia bacterium]
TPQVISGSGTISIGNQASDSSVIKITAYSSQYPYENSENVSFEYMLIFPQLPAPVASPSSGDFDTTGLGVSLSVPDHPDAQIFYTLDGTDPATSGTKFSYTSGNPIVLGPYSQVTEATIRAYATKSYYKPGKADFGYTFNPEKLPKPVADPPGKRFHTETLSVRLYVPDQPDAVIRYTLDGSTPNLNSDLYTSEIVLNKNTTIKAIALKDGLLPGPVMTEVYIQSLPTSMKFYPDMDATTPYSSTISCNAGTPIPVIAKIFDQYDTCLTEFATENAPISWEIQEITGNETGTITNTAGYKTVFNPEKAYNTVKLIATFNSNGFVFSKEIELLIKPGDPYKMWLEADWDRLVSPNEPNPVNSIKLSSNKTNENVYGIIRDSIGNWVATSKSTIWQPAVHSVATVVSGLANFGEGVIYKGLNSGSVVVTAENTDLSLKYPKDSVDVTVLSYWYDSLKIVLNDSINNSVDSIVMNTNLDTTLYVFGFRDDGYGWEKVSANWSILDKSLKYNIANPPTSTHEYLLSPIDTASGAIKVSLDDDNVTIPDTVWVKFIPGPPVRVEFTLLTPDDSLIAGDTLTTEIRLYNGDNNLVYGTWCYPGDGDSVIYNNILDDGGRPDPYFIVDDLSYILKNQGTNAKETFVNGTDTAYFVLYYAPYDEDSLHQLSITLDQSITDNTRPFRLLPGKLNKIDIAVGDNTPDTLVMHYSNGYIIKTLGYDLYGNTISLVECNWSTTGDIPEIKYPDSTKQIYYEIDDVLYKTTGCIIAKNIDDPDIIDSVYVIIGPKPAVLSEAVTQDLTGNGYLDAIKISFDKKVLFPVNIYTDNLITLKYAGNSSNINFDIKEIIPLSASSLNESDSAYLLTFDEYTIDNEPQTDWLPLISMTGISDMESIANKQCKDGAPPVVWDVEKKKDSSGDIEKDKVYITLSEPFKSTTGSDLMYAAIQPKAVFHVWTKSESNFELEENILDGIQFFSEQNGNTLMFNTSNGNVINANHYFSLTYQECLLADVAQNTPAKNNQKVRVRVSGKIEKLIIGPNPIKPTMKFWEHEKNLPLSHVDSKVAYNKVKTYGGGIVVVDIDFSGQEFTQASAQLMVFDATGNLVHAKENRGNVIPSDWNLKDPNQNETRQLIFYWDGISDRGMMAAPGVYRAVVFIQFGRNIKKITGTVGVGR